MSDLVEFLRARLDEDEQVARACPYVAWEVVGPPAANRLLGGVEPEPQRGAHREWLHLGYPTMHTGRSFDHAARHDPARVLREVEAERQIIHAHAQPHECIALTGSGERSVVDGKPWELWEPAHTDDHGPCHVLRCLALPHADHDDYREEWRP